MKPEIIIGESRIKELQKDLGSKSWPEFMQHDSIVNTHWPNLYKDFLNYQFALFENNHIIGVGNTLHLNWENSFEELPEKGIDWAMEKADEDIKKNVRSNLLVGLQILIHKDFLSKGISYRMLDVMKGIARSKGLKNIALPVRPTLKYQFPLIPMSDYIRWKNKNGLPFDPWIRVHINAGGKIFGICERSMEIKGSVSEWEDRTGLKFPGSGKYIVDKALVPIIIDKKNDIGTYIEPNVWMVHQV